MWMLALTLACGEDEPSSDDSTPEADADTDADTDTDADADADTDSDADSDYDPDKLRPGYFELTYKGAIADTCGLDLEVGSKSILKVALTNQDDTILDDSVVVNYDGEGSFFGGGENSFEDPEADCTIAVTSNVSGEFSDAMTMTRFGRHDQFSFTGSECSAHPSGGEPCETDFYFTGVWLGSEPPEPDTGEPE
jgi:hypothetical protein